MGFEEKMIMNGEPDEVSIFRTSCMQVLFVSSLKWLGYLMFVIHIAVSLG